MELFDAISKNRTKILRSKKKNDVINELIMFADHDMNFENFDKLKEEIFYREKLMSTGIGYGIAIPHARTTQVTKPCITVGICPDGVEDYESMDHIPVKVVFLILVGKGQHRHHIRILSQIVTELKNTGKLDKIVETEEIEEIKKIIFG